MSTWIRICTVDDIPVLGARRVAREQGGEVALFRNASDEVYALLDACPHRGGPLSQGIVGARTVACPLHNWQIGLADGRAQAPDEGQTASFAVELRAGPEGVAVWMDAQELATRALEPMTLAGACGGRCGSVQPAVATPA